MKSLCVFCGSSPGTSPDYAAAAQRLGQLLADRGVGLVYGGASVGLMGTLANATLEAGGSVVGVIPRALWQREVGHTGLTELRVVESMHERKALMAELSDAFLALPGGLGTLEELFEVWTWALLGIHAKPCALLNVRRYFDPLLAFIDHATRELFIRHAHRDLLIVETDPERLLARLESYRPPAVAKWLDKSRT
jgi:uncharacterized protein (TIGR00730 family)